MARLKNHGSYCDDRKRNREDPVQLHPLGVNGSFRDASGKGGISEDR